MGRVFQRGNNFWIDYTDARGRRVRNKIGPSEKFAHTVLHERERKTFLQGEGLLPLQDNNFDLATLLKQYLAKLPDGTRATARYPLERFLKENSALTVVDQLTPLLVETWFRQRMKKGWSGRTCNLCRTYLLAALNWGVSSGMIGSNPILRVARMTEIAVRENRAMNEEEITQLIATAREPYKTIWIALLYTGCRVSDLLSLKWRDVNVFSRELTIRTKKSKIARSRTIPIFDPLWEALKDKHGAPDDPLFCGRRGQVYQRDFLYRQIKRDLLRARIDTSHLGLHAMRTTFSTVLLKNKTNLADVAKLLGHTSPRTTMAHYAKVVTEDLRSAGRNLPSLKPTIENRPPSGGKTGTNNP